MKPFANIIDPSPITIITKTHPCYHIIDFPFCSKTLTTDIGLR